MSTPPDELGQPLSEQPMLDALTVTSTRPSPPPLSSGGPQYLRRLSMVITGNNGQGLDFSDFRVEFRIRRGDIQTPNSADIRIYNLSDNTANLIQKEFTQVSLSAGYQTSNYGLIFTGTICQVRKGRVDQKDSYVDITAADGDEAYNFAPIFVSVKSGTSPDGVLNFIKAAMVEHGVSQEFGYAPNFSQNGCIRGKVLYGLARDVMRQFAWTNSCRWSIQDGMLTVIPYAYYIPATIPIISPTTGLIGVPEQTQGGINLRVLLNSNIRIGQLVRLESADINQVRMGLDIVSEGKFNIPQILQNQTSASGLYYVMAANHTGDTRGTPWYTDLFCLSVDATVTNGDVAAPLFQTGPVPIFRY